MAYFKECEYCHAALDPGEKCDCRESREARAALMVKRVPLKSVKNRVKKEGAA
jgi:hypothetical protein